MSCPDESTLVRAASEATPGPWAQALAPHLADCPSCTRRVQQLASQRLPETVTRGGPAQASSPGGGVLGRGTPLGRYIVLECLGAGGVGIVYAAYDPVLDRRVAVKLLRGETEAGSTGDDARARLLREAQAMARLSHPNVVTVHDVGTVEGRVFLAMELVESGSLALWLKEQRRPWRQVLGVFLEAGRGLAAVHAAGLVHRDFKPGNVLLREDGRAQVTDFGLVRVTPGERPSLDQLLPASGEGGSWHTEAGALLGTPAYMAPEQLLCESVDARSDQFAFAVALWEAWFGAHPFLGAATLGQQLDAIRAGPAAPPEEAGVPRRLVQLLRRALAANPDQRFASMEALLKALSQAAASRRAPWVVAGTAVLLLAAAGGVVATRSQEAARCEQLAGAGHRTWDSGARAAVQAAFAATGLAHAPQTFARVERRLESYATRWAEQRRQLCQLEVSAAAEAAPQLEARRICLERRHDSLAALVMVLEAAAAPVVDKAAGFAYGLPALEDCAHASPLHANPSSPEGAAEATALRTALAHQEALLAAGRYQEAAAQLPTLLERTRQLGFEPLWVEALLRQGHLQLVQASPLTKETFAEAGYRAYALGQDTLAFEAWLQAAAYSARRESDAAEAQRWLRFAEAALNRMGNSDAQRAHLLLVRAGVRRVARQEALGLEDALEAVRLHRRVLHPDDPGLAASLNEVGTLYEALGQHAQALQLHQESVAWRERTLGQAHPLTSLSLTNLCSSARSLGRLAEAEAACRRAVQGREVALGLDHPDLANSLNSLGAVLSARGQVEEALVLYRRALEIRRRALPGSPQVAVQLNNIGAMLRRLDRLPEARAVLEECLALCAKLGPRCGPVRSGPDIHLGEIALAEGRARVALAHFQRSRAMIEEHRGSTHPELAPALLGMGKAQLALGDWSAAVQSLEQAVARAQQRPLPGRLEEAQFQLARARWTGGVDRPGARRLAEAARQALEGVESQRRLADEISGWLAAHPR